MIKYIATTTTTLLMLFFLLATILQPSLAQLPTVDPAVLNINNCTAELLEFCDQFLLAGGMDCHRDNQVICHHPNQTLNDRDYCNTNATYNCRTFTSRYGYFCNASSCMHSDIIY